MKFSRIILLAAMPAMLSCQQDDVSKSPDASTLIKTRIADAEGSNFTPTAGDSIGLFFGAESDAQLHLTSSYNGTVWETNRSLTAEEAESITSDTPIEAYTPWGPSFSKNVIELPSVNQVVDQSTDEKMRKSDFLYDDNTTYTKENYSLSVSFKHRLSQLQIIYAYSADLDNTAPSELKLLNQPSKYTKTDNGTWQTDGSGSIISIIPKNVHAAEAEKSGVITAILLPGLLTEGTDFMTFRVGDKSYTVKAPQDIILKEGKTLKYYLAVGQFKAETIKGELVDWTTDDLGNGTMIDPIGEIKSFLSQWEEENAGSGSMNAHGAFVAEIFGQWIEETLGEGTIVKDE